MIDIFDVKSELEGFLMAYRVSLARLRACVEGLTPEQLNWRPPAMFALVPIIGPPRRRESSRGIGWSGTRRPIVAAVAADA